MIALFVICTSAVISYSSFDKIGADFMIKFESKDPTGTFDKLEGTITFDENDLAASKFDLKFPISSINTANKIRDKKALTEDWFDAEKFPYATYKSTSVEKSENGYWIRGELTIKGITRKQTVPMLVKKTATGKSLYGSFEINRIEFGVGQPNGTVPDKMLIKYIIPLVK